MHHGYFGKSYIKYITDIQEKLFKIKRVYFIDVICLRCMISVYGSLALLLSRNNFALFKSLKQNVQSKAVSTKKYRFRNLHARLKQGIPTFAYLLLTILPIRFY